MVRDVVDRHADFPRRAHDTAQIVEKVHLPSTVLHPWPELARLAQEVVVEVDAQKCRCPGLICVGAGHEVLTALRWLCVFRLRADNPRDGVEISNEASPLLTSVAV
jgi:hypothetical protein